MPALRPRSDRHHCMRMAVCFAFAFAATGLATVFSGQELHAQARITTPKEAFGANFGDDYFLANYTQISGYWRTLEQQSDRIKVVEIGTTAEGRQQMMAIVSSPANIKNLDRLKAISSQLAHATGLTDARAKELAKEGRTVVWIDPAADLFVVFLTNRSYAPRHAAQSFGEIREIRAKVSDAARRAAGEVCDQR